MTAVRKQQAQKETNGKRKSHLSVVRGGLYPATKKEKRIEQLWIFCHAALWNTQQFTEEQTAAFKKLIADYFKSNDADKTFRELVERVCLAKRYVNRKRGRYISKPIDWLNINYKNGLAGTASWYKDVVQQRKTVPHYNEGISTLSRAVLSYCDQRNVMSVTSHRNELLEQKQNDLVQIYMNTIMHLQYINY